VVLKFLSPKFCPVDEFTYRKFNGKFNGNEYISLEAYSFKQTILLTELCFVKKLQNSFSLITSETAKSGFFSITQSALELHKLNRSIPKFLIIMLKKM